ncbi:hypothetical protein [Pseudonocardia phyllosphaerae]|uniref:hypothetical protein n=1 Tax=Pseudonocardia phyllosphaerae TaxID=3390502 RepID=UPI00397E3E45
MTGVDPAIRGLLGGSAAPGAVRAAARDAGPQRRWAGAVALGGAGYYAAAAAVLDPLRHDPAVAPAVRAHAAVTRASHLRQLGGHARAAALDGTGLRLALASGAVAAGGEVGETGDVWGAGAGAAVADACTGLAADALGRGDAGGAARLLDRAAPWCVPGSRSAVRYGWVAAETALLRGDPAAALAAATAALTTARALGSVRHVLKSRVVRAVAAGLPGSGAGETPAALLAELDDVAARALGAGLLPLRWPALFAGADLAARHAEEVPLDTHSRQTAAEGRRHAGLQTVSALFTRCDRLGRDLLRESCP